MMFTLYRADCIGNRGNCLYPNKINVTDETALTEAVKCDYVCAEYQNSYRSGANFIGADCLPVDCDNDHSEDPADWVVPADIANAFPGVEFAVHYSRNNLRQHRINQVESTRHEEFSTENRKRVENSPYLSVHG